MTWIYEFCRILIANIRSNKKTGNYYNFSTKLLYFKGHMFIRLYKTTPQKWKKKLYDNLNSYSLTTTDHFFKLVISINCFSTDNCFIGKWDCQINKISKNYTTLSDTLRKSVTHWLSMSVYPQRILYCTYLQKFKLYVTQIF